MLSWRYGFQLAAQVPGPVLEQALVRAARAGVPLAAGLAHHHAVHAVGLDVVLGRGDLDDRHPLARGAPTRPSCSWKRYCLARRCTRCFQTRTARRALRDPRLELVDGGRRADRGGGRRGVGVGVASGSARRSGWAWRAGSAPRPGSAAAATAAGAASAAFRRWFDWRRARLADGQLALEGGGLGLLREGDGGQGGGDDE